MNTGRNLISLKWDRRVRALAAEYGYDPEFLLDRFGEVMAEDGDTDYFVGVTMERDW